MTLQAIILSLPKNGLRGMLRKGMTKCSRSPEKMSGGNAVYAVTNGGLSLTTG